MSHVSAQGVDERMIMYVIYYYYLLTYLLISNQMIGCV